MEEGAGVVLIIMHGSSRMTIDPRSPTMPRRSERERERERLDETDEIEYQVAKSIYRV